MLQCSTVCPTCGADLGEEQPDAEIALADATTNEVVAVQRMVRGHCASCGPRLAQRSHIGNHSTLSECEMRERYPKKVWAAIKSVLEASDRRRFTRALHGKVWVTEVDLRRWDQAAGNLLSEVSTSPSSER